jgi:hypothetical protein
VICPILSNRGSFRYCLVRKSRTIAKITSTGRCTTLRRLEEVFLCELYPSRATVAEFSHRKAETTTKQRNFLKNHPTCALKGSHTCCSGLDIRQDTSVLAPL